jgi:hypothetical protein
VTLRKRRDYLGQAGCPLERVELVSTVCEAGGCVEVVVGPDCNDEEVGLVDALIGGRAPPLRIDRDDRLLKKPHARLLDVRIREPSLRERPSAEHHVELGIPE